MSYAHLKTLTKSGCMCFLRNFSLGLWDFEWAPDAHGWPPSFPWRSDPRPSSHQWMPRPAKQKWLHPTSRSEKSPRKRNILNLWATSPFCLIPWVILSYFILFCRWLRCEPLKWLRRTANQPCCQASNFVRDVIYVISHGSKLGTSWNLLVPRDFNSSISADLIM